MGACPSCRRGRSCRRRRGHAARPRRPLPPVRVAAVRDRGVRRGWFALETGRTRGAEAAGLFGTPDGGLRNARASTASATSAATHQSRRLGWLIVILVCFYLGP